MGRLWARIRERILPTQESASARRRAAFSTLSVHSFRSKASSESLRLASVDSAAAISRSDLALVRIWLAVAACSVELVDETITSDACFYVDIIFFWILKD